MAQRKKPVSTEDSLDRVARLMAIEEALINQVQADTRLAPAQRERLIREIEARIERAEFGDEGDFDDDALAALVRKAGPRGLDRRGLVEELLGFNCSPVAIKGTKLRMLRILSTGIRRKLIAVPPEVSASILQLEAG